MRKFYRLSGLVIALCWNASAGAGDIQIEAAWARATAPGQGAASVDLTITSKQAATLTGVASNVAQSVEMHSMTYQDGVMKMRRVKAIALPAGKAMNLGESGYHLMLVGLKAPFAAGESIPLTLAIKLPGKRMVQVEIKVEVKPLTTLKPAARTDEHEHQH